MAPLKSVWNKAMEDVVGRLVIDDVVGTDIIYMAVLLTIPGINNLELIPKREIYINLGKITESTMITIFDKPNNIASSNFTTYEAINKLYRTGKGKLSIKDTYLLFLITNLRKNDVDFFNRISMENVVTGKVEKMVKIETIFHNYKDIFDNKDLLNTYSMHFNMIIRLYEESEKRQKISIKDFI